MLKSWRTISRAVAGTIAAPAMAGAILASAASVAFADPNAPGCTAADLAQVSGSVATATSDYLFSHPDVNNFFTSLRGKPNTEIQGDVQKYMDANPDAKNDLNGIRQPLTDLRNRCQ